MDLAVIQKPDVPIDNDIEFGLVVDDFIIESHIINNSPIQLSLSSGGISERGDSDYVNKRTLTRSSNMDDEFDVFDTSNNFMVLDADMDMDNTFYTKFKCQDSIFDSKDLLDKYVYSNSPLTMSANNSDADDEADNLREIRTNRIKTQLDEYSKTGHHGSFSLSNNKSKKHLLDDDFIEEKKKCIKKQQYHDIEVSMSNYYDRDEFDNKISNKMDILITYMRGQKSVYMYSNYITFNKYYFLLIPTLILSSFISIMAPIIIKYYWSGGFICGINVIITTLISIMNYAKYELHADNYLHLANKYDKLEISLEMTNNKLIFVDDDDKNSLILSKLTEIEIQVNEMKEIYNVLYPEDVVRMFPNICNINIFSIIRKMELNKQELIHKLVDIKNEIRYILHKWKKLGNTTENLEQKRDNVRLLFLYNIKSNLKTEYVKCKTAYYDIEQLFAEEIQNSKKKRKHFVFF
jgi:hypothetical protein